MKLKLDENLGRRGLEILAAAGHDVATVPQQEMQSATDGDLILACHEEGRALVTLDMDFANPLRFPPRSFSGIAVLRMPRKATEADLVALIQGLVEGLGLEQLSGKLWIVEPGRIRIFQESSEVH